MKETDAVLQRQVVPLRPIDRGRGWPSSTRTDTTEGKWGNCYNKSGMCFFLDFLHAAGGAGCKQQLLSSSALTQSLELASASACARQVGTQGKRSFRLGSDFVTCFPFLFCFPPSSYVSDLQKSRGQDRSRGSRRAGRVQRLGAGRVSWQRLENQVRYSISKTVSVSQPSEQRFLPLTLGLNALFLFRI